MNIQRAQWPLSRMGRTAGTGPTKAPEKGCWGYTTGTIQVLARYSRSLFGQTPGRPPKRHDRSKRAMVRFRGRQVMGTMTSLWNSWRPIKGHDGMLSVERNLRQDFRIIRGAGTSRRGIPKTTRLHAIS